MLHPGKIMSEKFLSLKQIRGKTLNDIHIGILAKTN